MKNMIAEMKNKLEGKNRLNKAEDQISNLEYKEEKKHPIRGTKSKTDF